MAVAELIVSRRALLGAACASSLILSGGEQGRGAVSKDPSPRPDEGRTQNRKTTKAGFRITPE